MKKLSIVVLFLATQLGGCAAMYSDIRPNADGSYTLTYTRQGFFRVYGEVYRCLPSAATQLQCDRVDRL